MSDSVYKQDRQSLIKFERKILAVDIAHFTRYLATLMSAGLPLVNALEIIAQSHEKPTMQNLLLNIKTAVMSGQAFSEVLECYPHYFNQLYCGLIAASLQCGTLDMMLTGIADHFEKSAALKKKIKKAMIYPAAILAVSCIVSALLLIFVVPEFETLFSAYDAKLPPFTRMILNLSTNLQNYGWFILGFLFTVFFSFKYAAKHSPTLQYFLDRTSLKLLIFGPLMQKTVIARITRTLSTTLAAGVPLIDALTTVANAAGNRVFKKAILQVRNEVTTGQNLNQALKSTQLFPPMVIQMVTIGEESGSLEDMLNKVANYYEGEVDQLVANLSSLVEPAIMLILGVIIGSFVLAMYIPIFKLGSIF